MSRTAWIITVVAVTFLVVLPVVWLLLQTLGSHSG
jgi:hypothetical protein